MDRWQKVSRIFHEALALDSDQRAAFLEDACAGDTEVRSEVDSLLAAAAETQELFEAPTVEMSAALVTSVGSPLTAGERLAHYRIVDMLGAGGLGEVDRARDEQLDRDVAVKVLPAASFDDPAARAPLVREARVAPADAQQVPAG